MSKNSFDTKPGEVEALPARHGRRFAIGGFLWLLAAFFISSFLLVPVIVALLSAAGLPIERWYTERNLPTLLVLYFLYAPITIGLVYPVFRTYLHRMGDSNRRLVGMVRFPRPGDGAIALAGYVVYYLLALLAFMAVSLGLSQDTLNQAQDLGINAPRSLAEYAIVFVMLVVLPPIFEEILFRGYLFGTLRKGVPTLIAAVVTSVLFGLAHGQLNLFIDTFILSLVLCYVRIKTGSIWASMALHATKNGVAFVALYILNLR